MIKARAGTLRILGLSRVNIERLTAGQPIVFDDAWEGDERSTKTVIIFGETESAIQEGLATHFTIKGDKE